VLEPDGCDITIPGPGLYSLIAGAVSHPTTSVLSSLPRVRGVPAASSRSRAGRNEALVTRGLGVKMKFVFGSGTYPMALPCRSHCWYRVSLWVVRGMSESELLGLKTSVLEPASPPFEYGETPARASFPCL